MLLNAKEFERRSHETFAASYFTTLGIIQSAALGMLALRFTESFFSACKTGSECVALSDKQAITLVIGQIVGVFLAIILITGEYTWLALIVRRTPRYRDIVTPYVLGVTEFTAAAQVASLDGKWFVTMTALGVFGLIARTFARVDLQDERLFVKCRWVQMLALRNMVIGSILIALMAIVLFLGWLQFGSMEIVRSSLVCFYVLALCTIWASSNFLDSVRERFEKTRRKAH